ncbi:hypothetical protein PABG_11036 [Paracoccidioides brasiliensis Pb03]|nr:hypothetical protein PABG_11036 [Paracoccidioides brasiliensis Pb03]
MPLFALGALGTSPGKGQGVGESISTVEAENETLNRAQEKQVERRLRLKLETDDCPPDPFGHFQCLGWVCPGLTYLISSWYTWEEQQLRFAFLQAGEVLVLASGNIMNFGLNHLDGQAGLEG